MTKSSPSRFDRTAEIGRRRLRSRLIMEMTREGVQIAIPATYSGIDILAYTLPVTANSIIQAVPIQLATMSYSSFLYDFANWRTNGLLVVLLAPEQEPKHVRTFALSSEELMLVQRVGLTDSKGDTKRDVVAPASALRRALEPYCMVSGGWSTKIGRWLVEKASVQCWTEEWRLRRIVDPTA